MVTKNIKGHYSIGFKLNAGLIYSIELLLRPYCAAIFSQLEFTIPIISLAYSIASCSLRFSHVSLLIDMGFSATAIADRVGHESIDITYNYAHLFPSKQTEMAEKLDMERGK